jgi:hypothetical protein
MEAPRREAGADIALAATAGVVVMSTSSGSPFRPIDFSEYAPKRVRERARAGKGPFGASAEESAAAAAGNRDDETLEASPLAPLGPHEGAVKDQQPEDELDELYDRPAGSSGARAADEADRHRADNDDDDDVGRGRAADDYDSDLDRLETSIRWLRREADRLPRASRLPPVKGLRSVDEFSRESYIDGVRVPRSLQPSKVPPPPIRERRTDYLRGAMRILIACVVAAPIAYYLSIKWAAPRVDSVRGPKLASVEAGPAAPTEGPEAADVVSRPAAQLASAPAAPQLASAPAGVQPIAAPQNPAPPSPAVARLPAQPASTRPSQPQQDRQTAEAAAAAPRVQTTAVATASPPPAVSQTGANSSAVRALDADAIKVLIKQGEQFIAVGDLATARVVFQRAAEAGDAGAALALGATYDPNMLVKLGIRGGADIEKARLWYEKAKDLGSPDASRRLELMANR